MPKRSIEDWVGLFSKVHGNLYLYLVDDWSLTNGGKSKVKIKCKKHDFIFEKSLSKHAQGQGCPKCSGAYKKRKRTPQEYAIECADKHNNFYIYPYEQWDLTRGVKTKVKIECPKHGIFKQSLDSHKVGIGCPECSGRAIKTAEQWKNELTNKHEGLYSYPIENWQNELRAVSKVEIVCRKHGVFYQSLANHKQGRGCPRCRGMYRSVEEWLLAFRDIHGDKYIYPTKKWDLNKGAESVVEILCKIHKKPFFKGLSSHKRGAGCPRCSGTHIKSKKEWAEELSEVHPNKYTYPIESWDISKGSTSKIRIICPLHGDFYASLNSHQSGNGCPKCSGSYIRNKKEWKELFISIHGGKYEYMSDNWDISNGNESMVEIRCKKHNYCFSQRLSSHQQGAGCPKCAKSHVRSIDEWVYELNNVHSFRYLYNTSDWDLSNGAKSVINIKCAEHGLFSQTLDSHRRGAGCPSCAGNAGKDANQWSDYLTKIHKGVYIYPHKEWVINQGSKTKVKIICPKHGVFIQQLALHQRGSGCQKCAKKHRRNSSEWIYEFKKVHGDKYVYEVHNDNQVRGESKIPIKCKEHGVFKQRAFDHLRGNGCPQCAGQNQDIGYINDCGGECIKYGITNNLEQRISKQNSTARFDVINLAYWQFDNPDDCRAAESYIKSLLFELEEEPYVSKFDMPDGYTETCSYKYIDTIIGIYVRFGGVRQSPLTVVR